MSTKGSASNLQEAMKNLSVAWQQVKEEWSDAKSMEFEEKYIESLPRDVSQAIEAMEEVDTLLKKVRRDCE
jgi:hypothetical protein